MHTMIVNLWFEVRGECPYCGSNMYQYNHQWRHPRYYDLYRCPCCGFEDELPSHQTRNITRAEQRVLLELIVRRPFLKFGDRLDIHDIFPDSTRAARAKRQAMQRLAANRIFTVEDANTFLVSIASLKAIEWCTKHKGRLDVFEWWKFIGSGDLPF